MKEYFNGYRFRLNHYNRKHLFQSITIRTDDSLKGYIQYKKDIRKGLTPKEIRRKNIQYAIENHKREEAYLDQRYGKCIFKDPKIAQILLDVIFELDNKNYIVIAWSIMPNHVHLLLYMLTDKLSESIQWIKSRSALLINRLRNTPGKTIWAKNYFDRYIRSHTHFKYVFEYILKNPIKAHCSAAFTGHIQDWQKYASMLYDPFLEE